MGGLGTLHMETSSIRQVIYRRDVSMFRMLGNTVQLIRFTVTYTDGDDQMVEHCVTAEHRDELEQILTEREIDFTTNAIDQTGNEWFDGLKFNSYDEALEVFNKGEQAYLQAKTVQELVDNLRLRSDIDYIAIMLGVEI